MNQNKSFCVYSLTDPRDGKIKYIGATRNFVQRKSAHKIKENNTKKSIWVEGMKPLKPIIDILCQFNTHLEASKYERLLIFYIEPVMNSVKNPNYNPGNRNKVFGSFALKLLPIPANLKK